VKLSGVVVIRGDAPVGGYSPDSKTPNEKWSANVNHFDWNSVGDGFMFENLKHVVLLIRNSTHLDKLISV